MVGVMMVKSSMLSFHSHGLQDCNLYYVRTYVRSRIVVANKRCYMYIAADKLVCHQCMTCLWSNKGQLVDVLHAL